MPPGVVENILNFLWTALAPLGQPMAVIGGLALAAWNHPRGTQDVDLLVLANAEQESRIIRLMASSGFRLRNPEVSATQLGTLRISHWVIEPEDAFVEIEVDLLLGDEEFFQTVIQRSVEISLSSSEDAKLSPQFYRFASCEDLILLKLVASRMIDFADIQTLLERNPKIDREYLTNWIDKLDVRKEWESIPHS